LALECGNLAISELGCKFSGLVRKTPLRLLQLQLVESRNAENLRLEIRKLLMSNPQRLTTLVWGWRSEPQRVPMGAMFSEFNFGADYQTGRTTRMGEFNLWNTFRCCL